MLCAVVESTYFLYFVQFPSYLWQRLIQNPVLPYGEKLMSLKSKFSLCFVNTLFFSKVEHHVLKVNKMDFLFFPGRTESYKHDKLQYYTSSFLKFNTWNQ